MLIAPSPADEDQRLALLHSLGLLDSPPEPAYDVLTRLAARLLDTPIALLTLVDAKRQWFKSRLGLDVPQTPRDVAFCAHAILGDGPFVVPDAELDARFADNPLVTGGPRVRAYAGIPLRSTNGHAMGTLCVIDHRPRTFTDDDLSLLQGLADVARRELAHREAAVRVRAMADVGLRAIDESEALYHATFDLAAIGIAIVGLDGRWIRFNAKLCAILERSAEELVHLTFQDLTHPDDLEADLGYVRQLLDQSADHYAMEKRYLRPDGSIVWSRLTVTLVWHAGQPHHFISIVEDITARKEAELALHQLRQQLEDRVAERTQELLRLNGFLNESALRRQQSEAALAQSESELRAVLEGAQDAYISIDASGVVVEWNRRAQDTFGWSREEAIGQRLDEMIVPLAHRERHCRGLQALAATGKGKVLDQRLELPAMRRDGRIIPCEITVTALPTASRGRIYAAFLHDISERKNAERLLAESERRLNAIVNDQTDLVCRFDSTGQLVFANHACLNLLNLAPSEIHTVEWRSLVWPADLPRVQSGLKALTPSHPLIVSESRLKDRDGRLRWAEFVNRGFFDEFGVLTEVQVVGRDMTERKQLEAQLAEASGRMHDLYDNAPCGYHSLDSEGRFLQINRTALDWLGCTADEVLGTRGPIDFFTPESQARFTEYFPRFLRNGHIGPVEFDLCSRQGLVRRVSVSATAIRDAQGRFLRSRSVMYDISELHRVRTALQQANREQALMLDSELIGIAKLRDQVLVWQNQALERMFGYAPGELSGQPALSLHVDDASFQEVEQAARQRLAGGGTYRAQVQMRQKDGRRIWVEMSCAMLSPETRESLWMVHDITAMKLHQAQVEQLAFHDALTGLPNRLLMQDRLRQALSARQRSGALLAVCFVDLDGFKAVNDQWGHEAGDTLLRTIADRLRTCARGSDTVARMGGDEFVLLLTPLSSLGEVAPVLERILSEVARPVPLPQTMAHVSASIGVALSPQDGGDIDTLLRAADRAMYRAKHGGRNQARWSAPEGSQARPGP